MTQTELVLNTWSHLPQEVRDLTAPIETEAQYQEALELFGAVWDQVGEQREHPLGSLFVLLRDRIMAYETREFPVPPVSPKRVLAFLMEQRDMRQAQVAELLGITQSNVSRLLTGQAKFSVETIQKLAEHFQVSLTVFLAG